MRHISILILVVLLAHGTTFACLHADQNRIFPIGQSKLGLHVLELHQARGDDDFDAVWTFQAYHKIYDSKHNPVKSEDLGKELFFPEKDYLNKVNFYFSKVLLRSKSYDGFKPLQPKSLYFCDFDKTNPEASLSFDSLQKNMFVKLASGKKYEVTLLKKKGSIAEDLVNYFENEDGDQEEIIGFLSGFLCVNSVRKFELGSRKLCVVHLCIGTQLSNADGIIPPAKPYYYPKPFSVLANTIFFEDVLHHGNGFDFFIWE